MKLGERVDGVGLMGAAGIGICPALAATVLASLGLGVLTPLWFWLSAAFLLIGLGGFWLDYRRHRKVHPLLLFTMGSILLLAGRHTRYGGTGWEAWEIWGPGAVFVLTAFIANLRLRPQVCGMSLNAKDTE